MRKIIVRIISIVVSVVIITLCTTCHVSEPPHYVISIDEQNQPLMVSEIAMHEPVAEEPIDVPTERYLGTFLVTAYCPCYECSEGYGSQTSTGVRAKEGRTIAVDPKVIPYGSEVVLDGVTYIAEDCGGFIKGNRIDVYFETHDGVNTFGKQYLDVYIKI